MKLYIVTNINNIIYKVVKNIIFLTTIFLFKFLNTISLLLILNFKK